MSTIYASKRMQPNPKTRKFTGFAGFLLSDAIQQKLARIFHQKEFGTAFKPA